MAKAIRKTMNRAAKVIYAIAMTIVVMSAACTPPEPAGGEWKNIPGYGWRYGDTLAYNCGRDTLGVDTLALTIRHTSAYPYANLWLEMSYETGDTTAADTLNIVLADEFGSWYGKGSGVLFQLTDTIIPRRPVNPASPLRLRHIMRTDTVPEIQQIGLTYI